MDGRQAAARRRSSKTTLGERFQAKWAPVRGKKNASKQRDLTRSSAQGAVKTGRIRMARITLRQLLDHAAEHDYGVPAFNINNMEQALAIMDAASSVDAPVIIQASLGARSYSNDVMLRHMMDAVTEIYPQIPVCVHLDHGNEPATCMTAIQAGFTSVMMDGSLKTAGKTPGDWDYNVGG